MKKVLLSLCVLIAFASCHDGEDPNYYNPKESIERTVLVYISGENNLSSFINAELEEMRKGSIGIGSNALVVYVDDANNRHMPYIMRFKEGAIVDSVVFQSDSLSSHPDVIARVLNYTSTKYNAKEYGLVLWGHATGWLQEDSVATSNPAGVRRAYGLDNGIDGNAGKWINTPTLSKVLRDWGHHLKFIFADCCQFQCIENAYELRTTADYIIASPSEIPGKGAPYSTVVKGFFDPSENFYRTIVDRYYEQIIPTTCITSRSIIINYNSQTPLSVIKTSALPRVAQATIQALSTFLPFPSGTMPDLRNDSLIYYSGKVLSKNMNIMYDMNDFILHYANTEAYAKWRQAFDEAVIYKTIAHEGWMTQDQIDPYVFGKDDYGRASKTIMTDERYGGVSMFIPQEIGNNLYLKNNQYIKNMSWYYAAQLSTFGW